MPFRRIAVAAGFLGVLNCACPAAFAVEHFVFKKGDDQARASGKVLVQGEEGGVLLLARDGSMYVIEKEDIVGRDADERPFKPFTPEETAAAVLAELPKGFKAHHTKNYVICHNNTDVYARWCGELFERILKNFSAFWEHQGFKLGEPELPLVAVVFADRKGYQVYARKELGDAAAATFGLYSLYSNRIMVYDLTGVTGLRSRDGRPFTKTAIERLLARPQAERNVATVIHEATHQVAFNTGLQKRFADNPRWLSEGLAMYFETLKVGNRATWGTSRPVNPVRVKDFRAYLRSRPANSLKTLLAADNRFLNPRENLPAHGEAWALVYFLMKNAATRKQFVEYLKLLSKKDYLDFDEPEERLKDFETVFGDVQELDRRFIGAMRRVR